MATKENFENDGWIEVSKKEPERRRVVETKIDDAGGCRNVAKLFLGSGNLWFLPDCSMYVYYTPTHWREIQ